ncbi:hypothetical protein N7481_010899 [Penicillium waksmanii]|uniref:uncharacterized protein n=1 Tax=Penicillium waksmanii TaxID=69791 RepID=UPI002547FAC4|nr:uncharacterized protein N7481_010899 [Penicillium waksmanii]KAJ5973689.1 hypothetical protein N7481_010899 [Penicillium waksmanii]
MRSVYALTPLAAAIGAVASQPADSWVFGNSLFYLGPPSGNSYIAKATYSIVPPSVPWGAKSNADDEPWVSVWVGASSTAGDQDANLYQPIFNWCPDQESQYAANILPPLDQYFDNGFTIGAALQLLRSVAVVNSKVVQTVTMNDEIISKESDALDAPLQYLYSSNECYTGAGSCGSLTRYHNTEITNLTVTLSEVDTRFDSVMSLDSVTDAEFKSTDGGITWHTDRITVNTIDFDSSDDTQVQ